MVEKEQEVMDEVEQLRKRLDSVRSIFLFSSLILYYVFFHVFKVQTGTKTKPSAITIPTYRKSAAQTR